jgi:excisionase family DNA binding protein
MTNQMVVANAAERPRGKPLLSVAEAAQRLGISESAAYRLAASDALPGLVRLPGARMRVRAHVLDAWLNGHPLAAEAERPSTR